MPPKRLRVLPSFTREPDESVVQTTRDAIAGLKDNNYFPHPPADPATLEAKLGEFIEAITAANQGGPHDRLFKQKKRDELVMLLRNVAGLQVHAFDMVNAPSLSAFFRSQCQEALAGVDGRASSSS